MYETAALLREYDRARAYTDELWKDLTADEITWRPHENSSAVGSREHHASPWWKEEFAGEWRRASTPFRVRGQR